MASDCRDEEFGSQGRRPDLVLANRQANIYKIVDVAVSFMGGKGSLAKARRKKTNPLRTAGDGDARRPRRHLRGDDATPSGARGAWDPANEKLLKQLIHDDYLPTLRRRMVSAAIRGSHEVYKFHLK